MTTKQISQLVSAEGEPVGAATSAPGCFIHDGALPDQDPKVQWGDVFARPRSGNDVHFYVEGDKYFADIAKAIGEARESICITGWQVNFDVELTSNATLFQCLEKAIDNNPGLHIYVMPWLSPKVGVDTGDFETMLAIFQLNAGLKTGPRAFALPAIAQSDMPGGLGIGFSHHQKLVVIDRKLAFVGGIDLAYGRRDDGRFKLSRDGRTGNELYNSCVPPIEELSAVDQTRYLTRAELFAACFDGKAGDVGTFATSAPMKPLAYAQDGLKAVGDARKDATKVVSDWWTTIDLMPKFVRDAQDAALDGAQELSRWTYRRIDSEVRGKLDRLRMTGSAHVANSAAAMIAWLNHASMDQLPSNLRQGTVEMLESLAIATMTYLWKSASEKKQRYPNLKALGKIVPKSGKIISEQQPRMPWHDVHSSIKGPSVSDLYRNFQQRWDGLATRYERSIASIVSAAEIRGIFGAFGASPAGGIRIPRAPKVLPAEQQPKTDGKCWVQVLRSAPLTMLKDEQRAGGPNAKVPALPQNNCLKAMLTAIRGAQKFIYIEGQFFQSEFGEDSTADMAVSGPMAALIDITSNPYYEKHARTLGIAGVPPRDIPKSIRWSKVDDVMRDVSGKGADFMNDLHLVLGNIAAIETSKLMGQSQTGLLNPIGTAISRRIERAIADDLPFHVYLVLPVHPEGTLNTLNIMTQLHLTMQSLVFGDHSLINSVRRAILVSDLCKRKMPICDAKRIAGSILVKELVERIPNRWKNYLTLLNLRTWETLGGRGVTEQIYVHSKLLIVDDRVAILGSANINDRSQLGNRDSELAAVVRDDEPIKIKLDGIHEDTVSAGVHDLRVRLWKKLFGFSGGAAPAASLKDVISQPASPTTWAAIQKTAAKNAAAYRSAFGFLPVFEDPGSSIWPTWNSKKHVLDHIMPFDVRFWRKSEVRDELFTWDAKSRAPEAAPVGIQGFIVALPTSWTQNENNLSGMNLSLLAGVPAEENFYAQSAPDKTSNSSTAG